mgnify:CR=1 FL=1
MPPPATSAATPRMAADPSTPDPVEASVNVPDSTSPLSVVPLTMASDCEAAVVGAALVGSRVGAVVLGAAVVGAVVVGAVVVGAAVVGAVVVGAVVVGAAVVGAAVVGAAVVGTTVAVGSTSPGVTVHVPGTDASAVTMITSGPVGVVIPTIRFTRYVPATLPGTVMVNVSPVMVLGYVDVGAEVKMVAVPSFV